MKQSEARTLYLEFAEFMAKKNGVKFTPTNKKELHKYLKKMIAENN